MSTLVFVYNADEDLFSSLTDFAHKILSPSTYKCKLCALTYDNISMKQEWKSFIETLSAKTVFLHRSKFIHQYKIHALFPAIFIKDDETIKLFISKGEIENCQSLQQLKDMISSKLSNHAQHNHSNI